MRSRLMCRLLPLGLLVGLAQAQPAGQLYDPDPPPSSVYLRLVCPGASAPLRWTVDGVTQDTLQPPSPVSRFAVLPAGTHQVAVQGWAGQAPAFTVQAQPKQILTVVCLGAKPDLRVIEDQRLSNQLKSLLSVYHLDSQSETLHVDEVRSGTALIPKLAPGTAAYLPVNPIKARVRFMGVHGAAAGVEAALELTRGDVYSLVLYRAQGQPRSLVVKNVIQKYVKP